MYQGPDRSHRSARRRPTGTAANRTAHRGRWTASAPPRPRRAPAPSSTASPPHSRQQVVPCRSIAKTPGTTPDSLSTARPIRRASCACRPIRSGALRTRRVAATGVVRGSTPHPIGRTDRRDHGHGVGRPPLPRFGTGAGGAAYLVITG